jgi:hypothetical protein
MTVETLARERRDVAGAGEPSVHEWVRRPARAPALRRAAAAVLRRPAFELAAFLMLAVAYNVVRSVGGADSVVALAHADDIIAGEGWLFDHLEVPLNGWLVGHTAIAVAACYVYAVLHYIATPTVFFMSRRRGGWQYWRGYWALALGSGVALLCYATYPAAPPRLTTGSGIVDVMAHFAQYGWWGGAASAPRGIGDATNQYAAVPSMHFGWALWCAIQLWGFKSKALRVVAVAYPTVLGVVVLGTGNHFLVDVVAGGACIVAAYAVVTAVRLTVVRRTSGLTALLNSAG